MTKTERAMRRMADQAMQRMGWRYIGFDEKRNCLQIQGDFMAEDLRKLADWLDDPKRLTLPFPNGQPSPVIDVDFPMR